MGLSLKEIKQQAAKLAKGKGAKAQKLLVRSKIEELKREIAMHTRRKEEVKKSFEEKVLKIMDPILRRNLEAMWNTFERMIDKKDYQIDYTIKLIMIADDQLQHTVEFYCDAIDKMINNHFCELELLAKENKKRFDKCIKSGKGELRDISVNQNSAETHFQLLLYDANSKAESQKWTKRGIYLMEVEGKHISNTNRCGRLRQYLTHVFFDIWNEYSNVFKSYSNNTSEIQKEVRRLREKDKIMTDIVTTQSLQIQQSDGYVRRLRSDLLALESAKQTKLGDRLNKYRDACKRLKAVLSEDCKVDDKQIKYLVRKSSDAIDWLERGYKKGETILKLAALSRKFETQREKVFPFANAPPHESTRGLGSPNDIQLVKKTLSRTSGLTRVWQKISNVKLSYKALQNEKELLEYENNILKQKIRESKEAKDDPTIYKCKWMQEGSSVSSTTLDGVLEVLKFTNNVQTSTTSV